MNMKTVNKVILLGNVSWNPKLRRTETNKAVCSFGLATNRNWTTDSGEKHEETDFHKLVAFGKRAEICNEYLVKGRLIYVEGRLHTHSWTDNEGVERLETEIYVDDMSLLDKPQQETKTEVSDHPNGQQAATAV
jgi:single-strand DNA-binding protein